MKQENGTIQIISAEQTHPLRHRILRPNQTLEECTYPLDYAPNSFHVGYFIDNQLVGVGSVFQEALEGEANEAAWRIRGMAVDEEFRSHGIGGKLLEALIAYAAQQSVSGTIWCNGRVSVQGFYERYGFEQLGDVFDLPPIGPHVVLQRPLTSDDR